MRTLTISKARLALVAVLATLLAQPALKAQMTGTVAVANIPFAFQVGSQPLPAGKYILEMEGSSILLIKGDTRSAILTVYGTSVKKSSPSSFIAFNRYGNRYFLRNVRFAGDDLLRASIESKAERRMQQQVVASNNSHSADGASNVKVATLAK